MTGNGATHLYLHIPYCAAKCPYCDFNSLAGRQDEYGAYVDALLQEVATLPTLRWRTVFIGGGTPTILPPELLERLMAGLAHQLHLAEDCEWTCEANPGSADAERFAILAAHGVNRLSIGVQSVQEHHLRFLGRVHDRAQAEHALRTARQMFPRVSGDLIIGLPTQTAAEVADTISFIADHGLDHASVYHLAIEAGTEFHARYQRGELTTMDQEQSRILLDLAWDRLEALGLPAYETSNFAGPGQECRHNLAYWTQADYHAAGAGAVSTLAGRRMTRWSHPQQYIAAVREGREPSWKEERLDARERLIEAWMLGLRLATGVSETRLQHLGDDPARWRPTAESLAADGLLRCCDGNWTLTRAGRAVQDAVTVRLMPE